MLKPSNISDDFDDVSLAPITGEGKALEPKPSEFDDEKVKKLLAELDALESNSSSNPFVSPTSSSNSLSSKNSESLRKEIHSATETQKMSQLEVSNKAKEETSQEHINTLPNKEDSQKFKKASLSPNNFHSATKNEKSEEKPNSSLLKVAAICIITLLLSIGAAGYSFWHTTTEEVNAVLPVETEELFADTSDEAANFVRKSNSKLSGTTLEQALGGYLNSSVGQNWQALGWKSSLDQEKQNSYSVTFVWKEGQERKETSWQLDLKAKKLVPIDSIAQEVTPIDAPNAVTSTAPQENVQPPNNSSSTQQVEKQNNNTNANVKINNQHID